MFYSYAPKESYRSADQALWERSQQDSLNRLKLAQNLLRKASPCTKGEKANALLVLSTYYRAGWFVEANSDYADQCLKGAAELGHSQACFELARRHLGKGEKEEALFYVKKGLEKIDDESFNSELTSHTQSSMKDTLSGLEKICKMKSLKI